MKYIITIIIFITSLSAQAVELLSSTEIAQSLTKEVMETVSKDKFQEGILKLKPYIVIPVAEFDVQMDNMKMQIPVIEQRFGKSIGYEFVEEQKLGDSLIQYIYLHKFEKHVMFWHFTFYKPKDKWLLNAWNFNNHIKQLFRHQY